MKNVLIFLVGAAAGSFITWALVKDKYEEIANEEIESVKEMYKKKTKKEDDTIKKTETAKDIMEYARKINENNYVNYAKTDDVKFTMVKDPKPPYVITPTEFAEDDSYAKITLNYFADGVLVDEDDNLTEDIENKIGYESLEHFGEFEDDSVYVRNEQWKIDYEILLDERNYSDVYGDAGE